VVCLLVCCIFLVWDGRCIWRICVGLLLVVVWCMRVVGWSRCRLWFGGSGGLSLCCSIRMLMLIE